MLSGRLVSWADDPAQDLLGALRRLAERAGEPLIREALRRAMGLLAEQFVMGRTIEEALARSAQGDEARYRHSFDMLGEAARTAADARAYRERYHAAIAAVSQAAAGQGPVAGPGVSVKLSALHPRLEPAQGERVRAALLPQLVELAQAAKAGDIGLTIDAEEAARLDLSLDLFAALCAEPSLAGWEGLGIAVQAYQRRALGVVDLLGDLADRHRRRLMVRLVKGAYWDSEIKWAQQLGLPGYPVYTRKRHTDLSYLACAQALLRLGPRLYPQFATHNAHTVAAILEMAREPPFELQRLHGMGEALYDRVLAEGEGRICLPRLRSGGHPSGPAPLPGPPPAGERRQQLLRQPARGYPNARRDGRRRPARPTGVCEPRGARHPPAPGHLPAGPAQFPGPRPR